MSVSILILTKNRPYLIRECLRSLVATVNRADVELILGDTGSTDQRVFDLYDDVGKHWRGGYSVERLDRYHFSANYNALAEKAKEKFLIFLNNDTVATQGWLEPLVSTLEKPWVGAAGPKLLYGHDGSVQHAGIEFLKKGPLKYLGYHPYRTRRATMPEVELEKYLPAVTGACLGIRRDTFLKAGGFDAAFVEEAQDVDLCLRLAKQNLRCAYVPKSVLYHVENGTRTISEHASDRKLFRRQWRGFIEETFFKKRFQWSLVDTEANERIASRRFILIEREQARGDVFASTALVRALKEENPGIHVSYRTRYPALVDGIKFIDRALGWDDYDDFPYDSVLRPEYELGGWRAQAHTWIEEMGRTMGLAKIPKRESLRPIFSFSSGDDALRSFYRGLKRSRPYVVVATGAGWPEREWDPLQWEALSRSLDGKGYDVLQIGGSGDYWLSGARHLFDRSLYENLAILESAVALVTVDSYPYHLGVAVGLPTVLLTCKSSRHTVWIPENATELRNDSASSTPLPGCRTLGCRQKFGEGAENRCLTPILKSMPAERVMESLVPRLKEAR